MLTIEQLKTLPRGTKLVYSNGAKAHKWRINGKLQSNTKGWKLPIKHGLYVYGYIVAENLDKFTLSH